MSSIPDFLEIKPNRVWRTYLGGKTLDQMEGKPSPAESHFPEDWIFSLTRAVNKGREEMTEEGLSKVDVHGQEMLLRDWVEKFPKEILGGDSGAGFLLKFLDSSIRLHVQCHPTRAFSRQHLDSDSGKTEGYIILHTDEQIEEPYIYMGFANPPARETLRKAIVNQDTDTLCRGLRKIPVKAGDCFLVPGGMPHAIGAGVFMLEIMEPTDFAVRLEFERGGYVLPEESRFMGRDIDFALDMLDFREVTEADVKEQYFAQPMLVNEYNGQAREFSLLDHRLTDCFEVRRLDVKGTIEKSEPGFYVAVVTHGEGFIGSGEQKRNFKFGDRFLIPARTNSVVFESSEGMSLILAMAGNS